MSDVIEIGLPKWPAMVVVGEPVTPEQAMEILVRTDSWMTHTNDKPWQRAILDAAGIKYKVDHHWVDVEWADRDRFCAEMGILSLEYLGNSRIASSWVGGAHGWCSWDGKIGSRNYNIGKWPSVGSVLEEWGQIAHAFPFLSLRCLLFSGETCEEGVVPLVEFVVSEGRATAQAPSATELRPVDDDISDMMTAIALGTPGRERGCTLDQLRRALTHVRSLRAGHVQSEGQEK